MESGSATMATVNPATASAFKSASVYPSRRMVTSFGVKSSPKPAAAARRAIMILPLPECASGAPARRLRFFEAHAAPAAGARRIVADELDPGPLEGLDHLGERVDDATHGALARLHPLDRRPRHARQLRQLPLVDAEESVSGAHLCGGHHRRADAFEIGVKEKRHRLMQHTS